MKLVSFSTADGNIRPGAVLEEANLVVDLSSAGYADTLAVIAAGLAKIDNLSATTHKLGEVRCMRPSPIPRASSPLASTTATTPSSPAWQFRRLRSSSSNCTPSIIGPGEAIVLPKNSTEPDYEAEFAFVIGKGGYRIPASAWRDHVYGYTIVNDVSARDVQFATSQWSLSKSFPTFCPLGPAIVTADEIVDPHALAIGLTIDGEVLQNSNTRELVFKIPELIEYISSITPLLPGDIVSTGTPPGVGLGRTPKRWLRPGETVTVTIEGLGALTNPVVAE